MRLEVADREEEGPVMRLIDELDRGRSRAARAPGAGRVDLRDPLITERARIEHQVLEAAQRGAVAVTAQEVRQVPFRMLQKKVAVGQAQLPAAVRVLAGQETGPARRAGRRGVESLAKEDALLRQPLQIRRRNRMPVWLQVPPRVVRMQVDYIHRKTSRLPVSRCQSAAALPLTSPAYPAATQP